MTPQAEFGPDVANDEERHPETHVMSGAEMKAYYAEHPTAALQRVEEEVEQPPLAEEAWLELGSKFSERFQTMKRNSLIAKGAALATSAGCSIKYDKTTDKPRMYVGRFFDGHRQDFYGATLADALIALAEAVGDAT